jgi:hypothetical protein
VAASGGFAVMEILFTVGGYPYGPSSTNVLSPVNYAPNGRIQFDFKGTAGVAFYFQYVTNNYVTYQTGTHYYNFYAYGFTPTDSNWHSYTVYFPSASGTPKLATYDPCSGCATGVPPFDPTQSGEIEIGPASVSTSTPYDFTIDNLRFD